MRRGTWAAFGLSAGLVLSGCGGGAQEGESPPAGDQGGETAAGETGGEEDGGDRAAEDNPVEGAVPTPEGSDPDVEAVLQDADGAEVGTVTLTDTGDSLEIQVQVDDLEPGFHGTHVHEIGECEPDSADPEDPDETGDFRSAGGHLGADDADHGEHDGDLPSLYVDETRSGMLMVETSAFTVDDLTTGDGGALIVHSDPDNFAHIPERYAPDGPDEDTLDTGDAGDRIACAVLTEE